MSQKRQADRIRERLGVQYARQLAGALLRLVSGKPRQYAWVNQGKDPRDPSGQRNVWVGTNEHKGQRRVQIREPGAGRAAGQPTEKGQERPQRGEEQPQEGQKPASPLEQIGGELRGLNRDQIDAQTAEAITGKLAVLSVADLKQLKSVLGIPEGGPPSRSKDKLVDSVLAHLQGVETTRAGRLAPKGSRQRSLFGGPEEAAPATPAPEPAKPDAKQNLDVAMARMRESLAPEKLFSPESLSLPDQYDEDVAHTNWHSFEEMESIGRVLQKKYDAFVDEGKGLDRVLGAETVRPTTAAEFDRAAWDMQNDDRPRVIIAPMKLREAGQQVVTDDFGGDWSLLRDAVRGTVAVADLADVPKVIETVKAAMAKEGWTFFQRPRSRFAKEEDGYKDIIMTMRDREGNPMELQVNTKSNILAKQALGHKLYEEWRVLWRPVHNRTATAEQEARYNKLTAEMAELYRAAMGASMGLGNDELNRILHAAGHWPPGKAAVGNAATVPDQGRAMAGSPGAGGPAAAPGAERASAGGEVPPDRAAVDEGQVRPQPGVTDPQVAAAMKRYEDRGNRSSSGGLFGGEDLRAREGFGKLPNGTHVVMTEGEHAGKKAALVHETGPDGKMRIVARIDGVEGSTPVTPTSVEPLHAAQSWRTEAGEATEKKQGGLFTANEFLPKRKEEPKEKPVEEKTPVVAKQEPAAAGESANGSPVASAPPSAGGPKNDEQTVAVDKAWKTINVLDGVGVFDRMVSGPQTAYNHEKKQWEVYGTFTLEGGGRANRRIGSFDTSKEAVAFGSLLRIKDRFKDINRLLEGAGADKKDDYRHQLLNMSDADFRQHLAEKSPSSPLASTPNRGTMEGGGEIKDTGAKEKIVEKEPAKQLGEEKVPEQPSSTSGRSVGHGRVARGDGKPKGFTRFVGNGRRAEIDRHGDIPKVGDIVKGKDGPWMITKVTPHSFVSDDHIEDNDAWATYKNGAGWYASYEAVPVEQSAEEAAESRKAQEAKDAEKRKAQSAERAWKDATAGHVATSATPDLPKDLKWEVVWNPEKGRTYSVATLPSGEKIGKYDTASYDDYRTSYYLPRDMHRRTELQSGTRLGMTGEQLRSAVATKQDHYYQTALDAYDASSPEERRQFDEKAAGVGRAKQLEDGLRAMSGPEQWEAAKEIYRLTGKAPPALPDAGRAEYSQASRPFMARLSDRVTDPVVLKDLMQTHATHYAVEKAVYGDDMASWDAYLDQAIPKAETAVKQRAEEEAAREAAREAKAVKPKPAPRTAAKPAARSARHVVVGNTFPHREAIKALGGRWDADRKQWTIPADAARRLPRGLSSKPL